MISDPSNDPVRAQRLKQRRVLLLVSGFLVLLGSVVLFLQRLPLPARCAIAFIDYLGAAVLWVFRRQDYSDLDGA